MAITTTYGALRPKARTRWLAAALGCLRSRQALARLDDAALRDIGMTSAEARAETRRPVWDVPQTWLR